MRHHTSVSAGDAVYRIDADALLHRQPGDEGHFPAGLRGADARRDARDPHQARLDAGAAGAVRRAVPLLGACASTRRRWAIGAERVKELESTLAERLYEKFAAIRVVKSFARERYEQERFGARSMEAMRERIRLTWQESLFSVAITGVTMIGTALVLWVGGLHVLRGQLTVGSLLVVIAYLGSVYGPLSAIAHTAGSLQEALASTRRVRKTLAHGAGGHRRGRRPRLQPGPRPRPHRVRSRDVRLRRARAGAAGRQLRGAARRDGRARRADRRGQDHRRQHDSALLRSDRRAAC